MIRLGPILIPNRRDKELLMASLSNRLDDLFDMTAGDPHPDPELMEEMYEVNTLYGKMFPTRRSNG